MNRKEFEALGEAFTEELLRKAIDAIFRELQVQRSLRNETALPTCYAFQDENIRQLYRLLTQAKINSVGFFDEPPFYELTASERTQIRIKKLEYASKLLSDLLNKEYRHA